MRSSQIGFTLIEVLIAVVVLSIGLLGLAGLQTAGLHSNQSANLRTQATLLAYDMIDRMRASRSAYLDASGNYGDPPAGTTGKKCEWDGSTVENCSATEIAQYDVAQWLQAVQNNLPGSIATLCRDSDPDDDTNPNDGTQDEGFGDTNVNGLLDNLAEHGCDNSGSVYAVKVWWVDEFDTVSGAPVIKRFFTTFQP